MLTDSDKHRIKVDKESKTNRKHYLIAFIISMIVAAIMYMTHYLKNNPIK